MSTKIIGATVGTPIKPSRIGKELKPVKTVNGVFPDENGDVAIQAGSGIHVGAEPPTDENIKVWVDTDEEAEMGGANIDVVAVPGQMLIVKAVDENGKPTEWETAERTHWKEYAEVATILEETTLNFVFGNNKYDSFNNVEINPGKTYKVMYNGVPYIRTAQTTEYGEATVVWFGTLGTLSTQKFPDFGDPFLVLGFLGYTSVMVYAREDGALFSITEVEEVYHTIDPQYIKDLYGEATVDVVPESRLTSVYEDSPGEFLITSAIDVNVGDKCVVKWNGVAYEGIVQPVEIEEGVTCGCLGNIGAMIGEAGTGEPFVVVVFPKDLVASIGAGAQIISLEGLTEVTVSIGKSVIVKIPEKYMPDCVVKTVNGISPDENGNVEVAGGGSGGGATWRVLDAIDLSSGAVLYEIDTTGCTEIMLVNKTALIGSALRYAWKGFGMEGRSNNIVGKAVGSQIRLTYLGGGIISGISPRSDSDTLMKSVAFDDAIENNNTLCLSFGSVTSGIIVVGGK